MNISEDISDRNYNKGRLMWSTANLRWAVTPSLYNHLFTQRATYVCIVCCKPTAVFSNNSFCMTKQAKHHMLIR